MPCAVVAAICIFVTTELSSQLSNGMWGVCGFVSTAVSRPAIAVNHIGMVRQMRRNPCGSTPQGSKPMHDRPTASQVPQYVILAVPD